MDRILMVGPVPPPFGGIASVMEDIIHSDLTSEYAFEVFPRSARFPPEAKGMVGRNLFRFRRFRRFFRKVRSGAYGLVHIHSADPAFLGTTVFMVCSRLARVPVFLQMHGTDWDYFYGNASLLQKILVRVGLRLPARMSVLYSLWAEEILSIVPSAQVTVLPNFVRRKEAPDPSDVGRTRAELGVSPDQFLVVMVGSVGQRKGCFEILKAVPQVVSQDDGVRFLLVGGEEVAGEMEQLLRIVRDQHLEAWVHFTGEVKRDRIALLLAAADVFLLPSFIEGMPMAIIEAMQAGVAVVATRINAIPDMVVDEESGLLINPGSHEEIARAVLRLRGDRTLRARISAGGARRFEDLFEMSRAIGQLRSLYQNM